MKKQIVLFTAVSFIGLSMWNCTDKMNSGNGASNSLKQSLSASAQQLNTAVNAITHSKGYQLLTLQDQGSAKSAVTNEALSDSVLLDSIKGVYEYHYLAANQWCRHCFNKLFMKTGSNSDLVIKLPEELALHPWRIRNIVTDTTLTNNFVIDVPDYRYVYSSGLLFDYNMAANASVNDTSLGDFKIMSSRSAGGQFMYNSEYDFSNGYQLALLSQTGDTLKNSFSFMKGDSILLKEESMMYKTDSSKYPVRSYQIIVGNVEISRNAGSDSISVYLNGMLQKNAKVQFVDMNGGNDSQHFVCHNTRDIQITFDDGTSTTLLELIGPSVDSLKSLQSYLSNVVFATRLVDYIAWGIHTNMIN